jgi:hypothetical protein
MLDFMKIDTEYTKSGFVIFPKFLMKPTKDLMIKGRDFYAIWDEERLMWSTDEHDVTRLVDKELRKFAEEGKEKYGDYPIIKFMEEADSGVIDKWHKYCQKQMRDSFSMLDGELIFSNTEITREKFASKRLDYPLEAGSIDAYEKLVGTCDLEKELV